MGNQPGHDLPHIGATVGRVTGRVVAVLGLAGLLTACSSSPPVAGPTGNQAAVIRSLGFPGPFQPNRVLSLDGKIWPVGSAGTGCAVERIDPATLAMRAFPLAECPTGYVAAGPGHLFLMVVDYEPGTNNEACQLQAR